MLVGLLDRVDRAYGARKAEFRHDILQQWDAYGKRWSERRHLASMQVFNDLCDRLTATREHAHVHHWSSQALQLCLDAQSVRDANAALSLE